MTTAPRLSSHGQNPPALTGMEPVLKGANSRVVRVRHKAYDRAYRKGQLSGLVAFMSPTQSMRFKVFCAKVAIRKTRLDASGTLSLWLESPNSGLEDVLYFKASLCRDRFKYILYSAMPQPPLDFAHSMQRLMSYVDVDEALIRRAQLRAAYTILLQGQYV